MKREREKNKNANENTNIFVSSMKFNSIARFMNLVRNFVELQTDKIESVKKNLCVQKTIYLNFCFLLFSFVSFFGYGFEKELNFVYF